MHPVRPQSLFSRPLHLLVALAVLLVPLLGFALPAHAATYTVTSLADSGAGSLRQAILDANATPEADTITITANGTITLASTLSTSSGHITINGPGANNLTISGTNGVGVFYVPAGSTLNLSSVTVANGNLGTSSSGGGIFTSGTVTVSNSTFTGNTGRFGGAIFNGGTLTISGSTFTNNTAFLSGAIDNNGGTLTITNSTFTNNTATGDGGVMENFEGTVTISGSTFTNNSTAGNGGAIESLGGTVTITDSTFTGNSAAGKGGGVYDYSTILRISTSTFTNNTASDGGGISSTVFDLGLSSTTFLTNRPGGNCSGVRSYNDLGGNRTDDRTCPFSSVPDDIALSPSSVAEEQPVGTTVGTLSTEAYGGTYTYALVSGAGDTDNGRFTISDTILKTAAIFDYETKNSYSIRVQLTDDLGVTVVKNFIITVSDVLEATATPIPTSTATPSNTPVPPTQTSTATSTPTNTPVPPTRTPTNTPLPTATALPVQSTVIASADSYVQKTDPKKNFGTKSTLIVDGTDDPREVYVRFSVNAAGTIRKAILRLYVTDGSKDGPRLYQAANSTWTESGLIWNNKPGATGPVLGNVGKVNDKVWIEYDVTSLVTANGTYSFVLVGDSTESVEFGSRESSNKPQLVLTVQP